MTEALLTAKQVSEILQVTEVCLEAWRGQLRGPPFIRLTTGKRAPIRYRQSEIDQYLINQTVKTRKP